MVATLWEKSEMTAEKQIKEAAVRHGTRKPRRERAIVFLFGVVAKCPIQRTGKIYERRKALQTSYLFPRYPTSKTAFITIPLTIRVEE